MSREPVLSRHRLPRFYRVGLAVLWLTPAALFVVTILVSHRFALGAFDMRFVALLLLMCLPALYIWREGVDVLHGGLRVHVHGTRTYRYDELDNWYFDQRPNRRVLTVWSTHNRRVLECRAGHLTEFPLLMRALKEHLRNRNWPE
jgi:hypothetical protein